MCPILSFKCPECRKFAFQREPCEVLNCKRPRFLPNIRIRKCAVCLPKAKAQSPAELGKLLEDLSIQGDEVANITELLVGLDIQK